MRGVVGWECFGDGAGVGVLDVTSLGVTGGPTGSMVKRVSSSVVASERYASIDSGSDFLKI